jgi:NADH-quinone oxidoreductase subunit L
VPGWVPILPVIVALSGIALAWFAYVAKPGFPAAAAWWLRPLHTLLCRKWYFDEIYNALIVTPLKKLGRLFWIRGDGQVIDGIGPNGIAASIRDAAFRLRQLQTGFIYDYAYVILAGLVVFLSLFILSL